MGRGEDLVAVLAVVVLAIAATAFVAAPAFTAGGFPLDDAWIAQVMARNLATTGVWGFEPGQVSSGTTSILWTLLMALPHAARLEVAVIWPLLWGIALLAGFCGLLVAMRRRDGDGRAAAAALGLLPALFGNAAWLAASGLEPLLLTFLAALAALLWHRDSRWTGVACALAALARPEGLVVGLTLAALGLLDERGRRPTALGRLLGPLALAVAASSVLSWATSGGWLPATFEGRRWLFGVEGSVALERILPFARAWVSQLVERGLGAPAGLGPLALAAAGVGAVDSVLPARPGRRVPAFGALVACALALNLPYLALLPSIGHGGRYQPLNLLLFPPLVALGVAALWRWLAPRVVEARARLVAAAVVGLVCLPSLSHWRATLRDGVAHIEGAHGALASWVASEVESDAAVAAFDIGALAYSGGHRVIDLGGLVDREYLSALRERRVPDYLRQRDVRWLALPLDAPDGSPGLRIGHRLGLLGRPDVRLEPVVEFSTPREVWARAFHDTGHALPRLVLFRMEVGSAAP